MKEKLLEYTVQCDTNTQVENVPQTESIYNSVCDGVCVPA